jgi:hypothetical protein
MLLTRQRFILLTAQALHFFAVIWLQPMRIGAAKLPTRNSKRLKLS